MSLKPTRADGYAPESTRRVRETLLHVATILGDLLDHLVVVGGLVPSLIIDQQHLPEGATPHAGTLDLDLGFSLSILNEERYQQISERLRQHGFSPDTNDKGGRTRQRWRSAGAAGVMVDFLVPPVRPGQKGGALQNLEQDFAAIVAPGLQLAFKDAVPKPIEGRTSLGEEVRRTIPICGPAAFVVMKALAFRERGENKDAYDLFYTVRNYGVGPADIARRLRPFLDDDEVVKALRILEEDFTERNHAGVNRVAMFLARSNPQDPLRAEVAAFVTELLRLTRRR